VRVEEFDQLGEIGERSGEPIDLVDDDHIDSSFADAIEQTLQCRTVGGSAGITAVVEALAHESPAFMSLALDIGFGRFPLRVEGIEVLFKTRVAGDAGVNRAAQSRGHAGLAASDVAFGLPWLLRS